MDWFLYENGLRHDRVKRTSKISVLFTNCFHVSDDTKLYFSLDRNISLIVFTD